MQCCYHILFEHNDIGIISLDYFPTRGNKVKEKDDGMKDVKKIIFEYLMEYDWIIVPTTISIILIIFGIILVNIF